MNRFLIVVVGVGALGSHVVQFLRGVDVDIRVIDFDRVESKNVASQFHPKNAIGRSKVQAMKGTMDFLWGRKLEVIPHRLTEDNVEQLLGDAYLVVDCLDNAESRGVVQRYCLGGFIETGKVRIPCLHGALDAAGSFGRVIWSESFVIDEESAGGAATCEDGEFLPFIVTTAAYIASTAQAFMLSGGERRAGWSIHPGGAIRT